MSKKLKAAELIFDYTLYPRMNVDAQHVFYLREALDAGAELPAVIVDKKSLRIIDGFHRVKAYLQKDETSTISVIEKEYEYDGEMFIDAMRRNSGHGRTLTKFDRVHCIVKAEKLLLETDRVAAALNLTSSGFHHLVTERIGKLKSNKDSIPLKRTISHMAGKELTEKQNEVNLKLSGMNQSFYVNQIVLLFESDLINLKDNTVVESLRHLHSLLNVLFVSKSAA